MSILRSPMLLLGLLSSISLMEYTYDGNPYKSKLPFDLYKEVLLNYRKIIPQLDIQKIQDIALQSPKQAMVMETLQMEVL